VELKGVDYSSFKVPPCRQCEEERREKLGIVKPNVVFFVSALAPCIPFLHLLRHSRPNLSYLSEPDIGDKLITREKPSHRKIETNRAYPSPTLHKLIKGWT
jgi:hypothetical protein